MVKSGFISMLVTIDDTGYGVQTGCWDGIRGLRMMRISSKAGLLLPNSRKNPEWMPTSSIGKGGGLSGASLDLIGKVKNDEFND